MSNFLISFFISTQILLVTSSSIQIPGYGNEQGKKATSRVETTLKEIYQDIYNWQDEVSFNANETLRNLNRFQREFEGNLDQLEIVVERFVKVLAKDIDTSKRIRLVVKLNSASKELFNEMTGDAAKMAAEAKKVRSDLAGHYTDVILKRKEIGFLEEHLSALRNRTMSSIIDLYFNITRMDKDVKRQFNAIQSEYEEVKRLKAAIIGLNVAGLGAAFIPGVSFIAMAILAAATVALELAAGKIDANIEELTKTYLDDLKRLHTSNLELQFIDIDAETVESYKLKFKEMEVLMKRTEGNKNINVECWNSIAVLMEHEKSLLEIAKEVINQGLINYHKVDMQNIKLAWAAVKNEKQKLHLSMQ